MTREDAFTGLEAAIVLIAFVVVAAVFSYVVLGAGFFTTQKSQETVYAGVKSASSSFEIIGNVYGINNLTTDYKPYLNYTKFTIGLTAGQNPLDVTKMAISYSDERTRWTGADYGQPVIYITGDQAGSAPKWGINATINDDGDNLLEPNEQFIIFIGVPTTAVPNERFTITLLPADGAAYPIIRKVPAGIDNVNILI
ncbi:MAG: flagellin [Methanolinea sp.]|nr:flagellin [Methanolinea sp.]